MKRTLSLLLILGMLLMSAGALAEDGWYLERGIELTERLQVLAKDDMYLDLFYTSQTEVKALAAEFAGIDAAHPVSATMIHIPPMAELLEAAAVAMRTMEDGDDLDTLMVMTDPVKEELYNRLPSSAVTIMEGQMASDQSVIWLMLSTSLSASRSYLMPEDFEPVILMIEYPGDVSAVAVFTQTGDGIVSVSVVPAPTELFATAKEALHTVETMSRLEFETTELPIPE